MQPGIQDNAVATLDDLFCTHFSIILCAYLSFGLLSTRFQSVGWLEDNMLCVTLDLVIECLAKVNQ